MSETDYAYCAGIIDGDGCIQVQPAGKATYNPIISITQMELTSLNFIKGIFGGFISTSSISGKRQLNTLVIQGSKSFPCLKQIVPYLRIKKAQGLNCLRLEPLLGRFRSRKTTSQLVKMEKTCRRARQLNKIPTTRIWYPLLEGEVAYAYCAGIVDSDGHVSIHRYLNKYGTWYGSATSIGQTSPQATKIFQYMFGGHVYEITTKYRKVYKWSATGNRSVICLKTLLPFLKNKVDQAKLCSGKNLTSSDWIRIKGLHH